MAKIKKKEIITACMNDKVLCRIFLRYDTNYRYCIPLFISDKLFLGAEEDDFILDGYTVRRLRDVTDIPTPTAYGGMRLDQASSYPYSG